MVLIVVAVIFFTALVGTLLGCGEEKDADIGGRDNVPANVLNMPRGWSTIAMKCDGHGHRVYASDHGDSFSSSIAVIEDPSCPGGTPRKSMQTQPSETPVP